MLANICERVSATKVYLAHERRCRVSASNASDSFSAVLVGIVVDNHHTVDVDAAIAESSTPFIIAIVS